MPWSWDSIDWSATGSWAQAWVTAGAVFWAATLNERNGRRAHANRTVLQLSALNAIYQEIAYLIREMEISVSRTSNGVRPPPPEMERFSGIMDVLNSVAVVDLPGFVVIETLYEAKHVLRRAIAVRVEFEEWSDDVLLSWCARIFEDLDEIIEWQFRYVLQIRPKTWKDWYVKLRGLEEYRAASVTRITT